MYDIANTASTQTRSQHLSGLIPVSRYIDSPQCAHPLTLFKPIDETYAERLIGLPHSLQRCMSQMIEMLSDCFVSCKTSAAEVVTMVGQPTITINGTGRVMGTEGGLKFDSVLIAMKTGVESNHDAIHLVDVLLIPP